MLNKEDKKNGCSGNMQFIFLNFSLKTDQKGNSYIGNSHFSILSPKPKSIALL